MKKTLLIAAVGAVALAAFAATPLFKTMSANGNAASPAGVIFPAAPGSQINIVNANWNSDTNPAVLSISGGSAVFSIVETNQASSSVTNKISSTNSLTAACVLVLQHAGTCYAATVSTWNATTNSGAVSGTNVVLASGGWGVATSVGDPVFLMDTPVTLPIGATTNWQSGSPIYSATLIGRPVRVVLTPALNTNKLNAVTAKYE